MPTGDRRVNIFTKRLLSKTAMKEQFLDFLIDKFGDTISGIFQDTSGVLDSDPILLVADGVDHFKLDLTNANRVIVSGGQIITIPDESDVSKLIPFENTIATIYHVGIRFAEVEQEADVNPRTGIPEYLSIEDSLGEVDVPSSITDTAGVKIAININSITESGVDHSGRTVRVWLVEPQSGTDAVAFVTGTSYYSAPNNFVDVPYSGTDYPFGQSTLSTSAADYTVFIKGVTWRKNTDLSLDATYAYIGTVTGGGAGNNISDSSIANQKQVFLNTLDQAYDGAAGTGDGRWIYADAGAVDMISDGTSTGDTHRATLRVNQRDCDEEYSFPLEIIMRGKDKTEQTSMGQVTFRVLKHTTAPLDPSHTASASAASITAVGPDFTAAGVAADIDFALLRDFDTIDGLYRIDSVPTSTQLDLKTLDGTVASFPSENGTVTVLRAMLWVSEQSAHDNLANVTILGYNEADVSAALRIIPYENTWAFAVDDSSFLSPMFDITKAGLVDVWRNINIEPLGLTSGDVVYTHNLDSLGMNPSDIKGGVYRDYIDDEFMRIESIGRFATPHTWEDDFHYNTLNWTNFGNIPAHRYYVSSWGGPPNNEDVLMTTQNGGVVQLQTDATVIGPPPTSITAIKGGDTFDIKAARVRFVSRVALSSDPQHPDALATRQDFFGLEDSTGTYRLGFRQDSTANANWFGVLWQSGVGEITDNLGIPVTAHGFKNFYMCASADDELTFWMTGMTTPHVVNLNAFPLSFTFSGLASATPCGSFIETTTYANVPTISLQIAWLDYWKIWDDVLISG